MKYKFAAATLLLIATIGNASASPAEMTLFPESSDTKINSFTSYELTIENVGPVKDVYTLSSQSTQVSVAPRQVELGPGASETVNIWYNPEQNTEEGDYSFTVTAKSRANDKTYSTTGQVSVIKDHKVDVSVNPSSQDVCRGEKATYNVEVTNNGIQKETFSLSTDYGKLSQNKVSLEDGETQTVKLTASSNKAAEKNFNVVAASTTSYAQDIENTNFNSQICYSSSISVTPESQDVAAHTEAETKVTVRNKGVKGDTFTLSTSEGELEKTELQVDAKSTESTTLTVSPEELGSKTVTVTAEGASTSSRNINFEVYNGNSVSVEVNGGENVCENKVAEKTVVVENTGEAEDSYSLSTTRGTLGKEEVTVKPGDTEKVSLTINASSLEEGKSYGAKVTVASKTFKKPKKTVSTSFNVENCWDLKMNVVPEVASAGENRSTIYEIQLENPGSKKNTYELSYSGPSWVEIKPEEVTIAAGERETSFMYAGIPFEKKGEVKINVTGTGNEVQKSQEVTLLIGEDVREAIKSNKGGITGAFSSSISSLVDGAGSESTIVKVLGSLIAAALITAVILVKG